MDFDKPAVLDGPRLHREVPAHRWSVTRQDLRQLRALVGQLVSQRRVVPTERDAFGAADQAIGPNIYTVNGQLIIPITNKAGKVSWALMLHPDGLECDLFVTHCWTEGIYEFIDKVLHSWPRRARHAYCCMLSNPQNLDIGGLISSPRESPFAKALGSATYMLVVPNAQVSIYSRIWCAYEAFLAYSGSKIIISASAPVAHLKRQMGIVFVAIACSFGTVLVLWISNASPPESEEAEVQLVFWLGLALAYLLIIALGILRPSRVTRVLEFMLAFDSGAIAASLVQNLASEAPVGMYSNSKNDYFMWLAQDVLLMLSVCTASALTVIDRTWAVRAVVEERQLRNGYTGTLRDAQSSKSADRERNTETIVLEELANSGVEEDVNDAVRVLLDSGVSTPVMRSATKYAGRLVQAGQWSMSTIAAAWGLWLALAYMPIPTLWDDYSRGIKNTSSPLLEEPELWVAVFGIAEALTWIILFFVWERDRRGFAAHVLLRIFLPTLLIGYLIVPLVIGNFSGPSFAICLPGPLAILLSAMGPASVGAVPRAGPCVLRCLVVGLPMPRLGCASWGACGITAAGAVPPRSSSTGSPERAPPDGACAGGGVAEPGATEIGRAQEGSGVSL